jgi:hypothetical protein
MNASDSSPACSKARRWLRCAGFGISRVTGYKIFERYKACGFDGLYGCSEASYRQPSKLPFQVERAILGIKKEYPTWGAPKIRDKLIHDYPMIPPPAVSTIHAALDRNGLVKRHKRRRHKACGTPLTTALAPNELWCADYKGEFLLGNRQYCYPLTVTDHRTRYLPTCEGLESTKSKFAFSVFERTFRDFDLPASIRTDNGVPYAAPWAMFGLSRLAVWWLRLGIHLERIKPCKPPRDPDYPFHDRTVRVTRCGRICLGRRKINLSTSLAEQLVGIREVDDQVWLVSFLEYDLGYFDRDEDRVEPGPNPFAPDTVLTMCPE